MSQNIVAPEYPRLTPSMTVLLIGGVGFACLMDSLVGSSIAIARLDMMGDLNTSVDEFAWLDFANLTGKFIGFIIIPWLFGVVFPLRGMKGVTLVMAVACGLSACTANLPAQVVLRSVQGLAAGMLVVGGQSVLFRAYPSRLQPVIQACFAMAAVVTPATLAPLFQGWMVDEWSWQALFLSAPVCGLFALGALSLLDDRVLDKDGPDSLNAPSLLLFAAAFIFLNYISNRGGRYNWFEADHITLLTIAGFTALALFLIREVRLNLSPDGKPLINANVFKDPNFLFTFPIGFIAGIILFGTLYMVPNYALSILHYSPTEAGLLLLPGIVFFLLAFCIVTLVDFKAPIPVMVCLPLGVFILLVSLWLLSDLNVYSGEADYIWRLNVRALGLGFLFLSINLVGLRNLTGTLNTQGVSLFYTMRQAGGLFGVAGLQRYADHQNAHNDMILSAHFNVGNPLLDERLTALGNILQQQGLSAQDALTGASSLLAQGMQRQIVSISNNEAFFSMVVMLFIVIPLLVTFRIVLFKHVARKSRMQAAETRE